MFFYTSHIEKYDFGAFHPLKPRRLQLTLELLECYGVFEHFPLVTSRLATEEEVRLVHSEAYLAAVRALSEGLSVPNARLFGFSEGGDNPPFRGMWEAALAYTGATVCAAEAVLEGAPVALSLGGGLHHALPDRASGFCILNDPAIAIQLLRKRYRRVAYVDIDLHHGDGVQWIFYHDPEVLTISIHESGLWLFPGTGFTNEIGEGEAAGTSVNLPLAPFTSDSIWWWAFEQIVPPVLEAFEPEAIVFQMGADPHYLDPLGHLNLTAQGWLQAVRWVKSLGKPIVALGGGGYNLTTVPRMWTLATAELAGLTLQDQVPNSFSGHASIPFLTDHESPTLNEQAEAQALRYAEQTVESLRQQLGMRKERSERIRPSAPS